MESRRPNEVVQHEPKFSVARCRLELRYSGGATPGPGLPERFVLDPEVTPFYEIGRLPADSVSLYRMFLDSKQQELMISRLHARFVNVSVWTAASPTCERFWKITDLGSTNGCLWNGVRVKETKLSDGDTITFGGCGAANSRMTTEFGEKPCENQPKSIYTFTIRYLDGGGGSACRAPHNSRASSPGRR